ncbi:DUF6518 family protein [Curtobacterium sp. NPDC087082]|uniref:DUF6518 family protein n=1 Tax=Curtobacterium sp. NPDC087082 TaxID=3363966 RepID=UPI003824BD9A
MRRLRPLLVLVAVALVVGVLTQSNTWLQASRLGVPYPGGLVGFLDTPSVGAALGFAAGALAHRWWHALVLGPGAILVSFVGYYGAYGWSSGASGAPSWVIVALLSGPVAGVLGWWWRARRVGWLLAVPIGFVCSDALWLVVDRSPHLDGGQFATVSFSMAVVAVACALLVRGTLGQRALFVGAIAGSTLAVFLAMSFVVWPLVGLLGGDAVYPVLPDLDGDGRPN